MKLTKSTHTASLLTHHIIRSVIHVMIGDMNIFLLAHSVAFKRDGSIEGVDSKAIFCELVSISDKVLAIISERKLTSILGLLHHHWVPEAINEPDTASSKQQTSS